MLKNDEWVTELVGLSRNIKRLRERRGWSQRQLALKLGTSHPVIARWEKPLPNMTLSSLQKLAAVFGVSTVSLLTPVEEPEEV